MDRRDFMQMTGLCGLQVYLAGCRGAMARGGSPGKLRLDPTGLLELAPGIGMTVLQTGGDPMGDGRPMPFQPDGMDCFAAADGTWILMRNHELSTHHRMAGWSLEWGPHAKAPVPRPAASRKNHGGVSRVVVDPASLSVIDSALVLAGTDGNCGGGTVDGAWISCEESSREGHGYAFRTLPTDTGLTAPRRIRSWGRFHREAVVKDPQSGCIYMTEDRGDGCLYRFTPDDPGQPFGRGKVAALAIEGLTTTSPERPDGTPAFADGTEWPVHWVDIADPSAAEETCRAQGARLGATSFYRGEGIAWGEGAWFSASTAGAIGGGQIFRLLPGGTRLRLEHEVTDRRVLSCPDNITLSPAGDLVMCEDNYQFAHGATHQYLRMLTPAGEVVDLARQPRNGPDGAGFEFAGACFSPDGSTLFVNLQMPHHMTVALRGPWGEASGGVR